MEKRNIIEDGRTPLTTEKTAEVVDKAAVKFAFGKKPADPEAATQTLPRVQPKLEDADNAGKAAD